MGNLLRTSPFRVWRMGWWGCKRGYKISIGLGGNPEREPRGFVIEICGWIYV